MFPDFPKLKERLLRIALIGYRQRVRSDGLIGAIKSLHYFEGRTLQIGDVDGNIEKSSFQDISIPIEVNRAELIERGFQAFVDALNKAVEAMQQQLAGAFYAKMDEITRKTGNVVDAHGKPFSGELFLDSLEKVSIDFDDDGKPDFPSCVVAPELYGYIKAHAPEWEADPAFQARHAEIIARKREEWRDRESNRKLVD